MRSRLAPRNNDGKCLSAVASGDLRNICDSGIDLLHWTVGALRDYSDPRLYYQSAGIPRMPAFSIFLSQESYVAFFAPFTLTFAHLARWASAIFLRAAADNVRLPEVATIALARLGPTKPLSASMARFSRSRSCFNCASTATRSVIRFLVLSDLIKLSLTILENRIEGRIGLHPSTSKVAPRKIRVGDVEISPIEFKRSSELRLFEGANEECGACSLAEN